MHTEGITDEHIARLRECLVRSGLRPQDIEAKNIALLPDGTPVVIDGGAPYYPWER